MEAVGLSGCVASARSDVGVANQAKGGGRDLKTGSTDTSFSSPAVKEFQLIKHERQC